MNTTILNDLLNRFPEVKAVAEEIEKAASCLIACYEKGGKVLVCGNGGSCSDADHIVGELMKGFERKRPVGDHFRQKLSEVAGERGAYLADKLQIALPAISLTAHSALITAVANDTDAHLVFAQQVLGYGNAGDVLIAISSSGNSQNVLDAIHTARAKGLWVIGLTGESGGKMKPLCDVLINVPGKRTALVQEFHLPIYHALCMMVEQYFFNE